MPVPTADMGSPDATSESMNRDWCLSKSDMLLLSALVSLSRCPAYGLSARYRAGAGVNIGGGRGRSKRGEDRLGEYLPQARQNMKLVEKNAILRNGNLSSLLCVLLKSRS